MRDTLALLEEELKGRHAPGGGKALELGCGAGDATLLLAEKGYEAHGVDIAPTAIEWARAKAVQRGVKVDFRVGNVLDLAEYPDDDFDLVLDGHCLHCIIGKDRALFLASARRVLKAGAVLHVKTMCGDIAGNELADRYDPESRCLLSEDGVATRYLGQPEDILDEIRSAGYQLLDWRVEPRTDEVDDMDDLLVWAAK